MHSVAVRVVLVAFLLFVGTVEARKGGITFWRDKVTLTCPDDGQWYHKGKVVLNNSKTHEFRYLGKDRYSCVYVDQDDNDERTYQFYLEGNVCKNCFEVDASLFGGTIILDLIFTSVIMIAIYSWTKKKSPAAPIQAAPRAPARPAGARRPAGRSVEYEQLNLNTRTQDTYSVVKRT
ncbi:T-cell surface glycoprotein CD3 epsilon chain-like [Mugil cephalus]|uniref:T-cell surface glycoprotein CD3 epsilon chain-like n=1 Tax=Mugil cephalus TaxID=48193 RepID=UPI001FB83ABD|nr:T-cell surface glycoprotein CD3 epsilon chain-like [Mugil cephalus]